MNDLSTRLNESDISIDSELFKEMLDDLDKSILYVFAHLYQQQFEGGEINIKIELGLDTIEDQDGNGEVYEYVTPTVKFNRNVVMKKQAKNTGFWVNREKELLLENNNFKLRNAHKFQTDMFDEEE